MVLRKKWCYILMAFHLIGFAQLEPQSLGNDALDKNEQDSSVSVFIILKTIIRTSRVNAHLIYN